MDKKPRKHNPQWQDNTRNQRQQSRRAALNQAAQAIGFETWAKLETAVINGTITLKAEG